MKKSERIALMFVGVMIGFALPFLVTGMALQITGSKLRIEIVSDR